jgi:hypothetical protein
MKLSDIATCLVLTAGIAVPSIAQQPSAAQPALAQHRAVTQIAGVENTKMGAYRALADLALQAFQKGDSATAAELARILERTWDAAEEHGGEASLLKRDKDLFEQIDQAMDAFIKPLIHYATQPPSAPAVQAAYNDYLGKLKQGD